MQVRKFILFLLTAIILVASCKKDPIDDKDVDSDKKYFPLKTGNYIIYKITEITIDAPSEYYDTVKYFIKEYVEDTIIDNQNDIAYRLERHKKINQDDPWEIYNVWQSKLINNMAHKVEENLRFVKIRFPLKIDLSWNGNVYNDMDEQKYEITELNVSKTINGHSFDHCLTVMQNDAVSLIHKELHYEIYAFNVGLIYKEHTSLNSQEVIYGVPIEERITTGTIYIQELVSYSVD